MRARTPSTLSNTLADAGEVIPSPRVRAEANGEPTRRHGDLFTAEQAAAYLRLDEVHALGDGDGATPMEKALRTLRTLIERRYLAPTPMGKHNMFHRRHLDACVANLAGAGLPDPPATSGGPKRGRLARKPAVAP